MPSWNLTWRLDSEFPVRSPWLGLESRLEDTAAGFLTKKPRRFTTR